MKETRFIAQNKEKWLESETLLTSAEKDPEKLSNLFTQVVDDLSYSRTYYQNRSVRVYLNKIAREYFSIIYSQRKEKKNRFKLFWLDELPQIVIFCRKSLLISLVVFLVAMAIGVFSSLKDPQFATTILGPDYIAMTKANIEKGDPMAVYKSAHQVDMFLGITLNNLIVAFRTYVFGIFFSIGTIAALLSNGIMVGCFQFFFVERGLFAESALTIWLHGTLEISSIILAGGAGLTLGSGLIFPGTYSRMQAFQISAIRSLKLMLGIAPILVFASIIESFLTRYTDAPDLLRLFLIILSAAFIIGYFIVYPWWKSKTGFEYPLTEAKLQPTSRVEVQYDRVKNNAEILNDGFRFFQKNINKLLPWITGVAVLATAARFFAEPVNDLVRYQPWWVYLISSVFYAVDTPGRLFVLVNSAGVTIIVHRVFSIIDNESKKTRRRFFSLRNVGALIQTGIFVSAAFAMLYFMGAWGAFLLAFTYLMFLLIAFSQQTEQTNLLYGLSHGLTLMRSNFGQVMGLQLILLLMAFSFLLVLSAPLLFWYLEFFQWNFAETDTWIKEVIRFGEIFIKLFGFNLMLPLLTACVAYMHFNLAEITSAEHLKRSISLIGTRLSKQSKRS